MNVDKHECRRIQWNDPDGTRRTLRLGKVDDRTAERLKAKVERLILSKQHGETDDDLVKWLARVDDVLYNRLAQCGMVAARESGQLGPWVEKYLSERKDLRPASRAKLEQTQDK